jgi:hypothetical protein
MADVFGPNTFSCHLTGPGTLATLSFLTGAHPDNIWGGGHLKFLWEDCSDNMLALVGGDTAIVSDGVFLRGDKIDYALDSFPTFFGSPDACLIGGSGSSLTRGVDFYDGEVKMTYINPVSNGAEISLSYNFTGPGLPVWVALKLGGIEPGQTISAFDILVQFASPAFSIHSVTMGDLLVAHSWEYFTYSVGSGAQCGGLPCTDGYVRIRGTADIANGVPNPGGAIGEPGTLAELVFNTTLNPTYWNAGFPVRFAWYSCADNVVTASGQPTTGWLSRSVYDRGGFPFDPDSTYSPTILGTNSTCYSPSALAKVDFSPGWLEIFANYRQFDDRGDININGISNEVSDHVLFSDWFMYGDWAFTLNNSAQRQASDVNADGLVVTLDDLVYLYRIITGQAIPFPRSPAALDTVRISQDTIAHTVSVSVTDSLSALYLVFDGEIAITPATSPEFAIRSFFDTTFTNVLISPALFGASLPTFSSGQVFSYTGDANLIYAAAAYDGVTPVPVEIPIGTYYGCGIGRAGNTDCDPLDQVDIADLTRLLDYLFVSRAPLCCLGEGNCDGAGSIDIADLTRLIDYLFINGASLAPCR